MCLQCNNVRAFCAIGLWSKRFRAIVTSRCLSPGRNANATRSDMMMRLITTTRHGGKRGCAGCNTPSGAQLEPTHSGPNPPKQPLSPWGGREEGERAEPRSIYPETAAREGAEQAERGPAREATAVPRRESNPGTALPRPTTRPTTQAAWGVTVLRAPPGGGHRETHAESNKTKAINPKRWQHTDNTTMRWTRVAAKPCHVVQTVQT